MLVGPLGKYRHSFISPSSEQTPGHALCCCGHPARRASIFPLPFALGSPSVESLCPHHKTGTASPSDHMSNKHLFVLDSMLEMCPFVLKRTARSQGLHMSIQVTSTPRGEVTAAHFHFPVSTWRVETQGKTLPSLFLSQGGAAATTNSTAGGIYNSQVMWHSDRVPAGMRHVTSKRLC